ncbi:MAG: MutS-related protein, partial [Blastocatellia bacterium]
IEALGSLAGYAYEHPLDPFPELIEGEVCFDGEALGHPLIAESRSVRNDVRLDSQLQVLIVSGSNMSGKSTLMRTIGVNIALALAGAPVRAKSLRMSPLAIGASIHILDSLQSGASRFYAEIMRLRQIVELTKSDLPLLFLLDEILSGTNSHDRRIGAEAVVKGLVERGAIGLVTTHDLALTKIVETLGERAANVHFEDHLEDGRMVFDYKMRPGVVQRSNALELMRTVGLEV